ncbi:MAG: acyloxyacyl hydrolase, partial [Marinirhabdus sp.]
MKQTLFLIYLSCSTVLFAQQDPLHKNPTFVYAPEVLTGLTLPANDGFPGRGPHKQLLLNFGKNHKASPQEWAHRLKHPTTGIGFGVSDFGNLNALGLAFSVVPYIQFKAFKNKNLSVLTGIGASYFTKKFDPVTNPDNQAVTTDITWAYRTFLYYTFVRGHKFDWRSGLGYSHHSNGHSRLLNQGYNSFLLSVSAVYKKPFKNGEVAVKSKPGPFKKSRYPYFGLRAGLGANVLALAYNNTKPVYTLSATYGTVHNNVFRFGVGAHYRFYQHYYDYIREGGSLVLAGREFENFTKRPFINASAVGVTAHGEFLLNHVGIELQLGFNLYKPAYKIEWRINEGWDNTPREIPEFWVLGEYTTKYKLKQYISSRIGLKYYLMGTE